MRIFSIILPVRVSGLLLSEFLIALCCYLVATAAVFRGDTYVYLRDDLGFLRMLLVTLSMLLGIFVNNLYADTRVESRTLLVLKMCNVLGIVLIVQGLLAYISSGLSLPRGVMLVGGSLAFLALLIWRIFYSKVLLRMMGTRKILFVGNDVLTEEIAARIHLHPELGFGICGFLESRTGGQDRVPEFTGECLGSSDDLATVAEQLRPNRIVIGAQDRRAGLPVQTLLKLVRSGILIEEAATTYEAICGRVSSRPGSLALQSIYANLVGISGIVAASPVLILVALAVKLTSRGPVLEPDVRVGQHGIPFSLNKFRCHRVPGDGAGNSLEERLTPVGRWLQKLHLVNLPRVFNLLRGEITLVGPRAERPEFVEELTKYFAYYRQRHSVKPGMTGWSQINSSTPEKRIDPLCQLEYDLYYTKHISLALDAYILLHGIRRLLPFARR
jgi:lipopolysaccharide/colanic/teichoic acid biosynthesis glycosyltransferase